MGSHIPANLVAGSSTSPFVSCLGWSQRIPRGQTCLNAPGRLWLGLLPRGRGLRGEARAAPGSRISQGATQLGRPLQPPPSPGALPVATAVQRWVSRVTEGSLRWDCGCVGHCNRASPVHWWGQWVPEHRAVYLPRSFLGKSQNVKGNHSG